MSLADQRQRVTARCDDLVCLTGRRPADALKMTAHDIIDGHLIVTQEKRSSRIKLVGEPAALLTRIEARKAGHEMKTAALLVNHCGKRLTVPALRAHFDKARDATAARRRRWPTR